MNRRKPSAIAVALAGMTAPPVPVDTAATAVRAASLTDDSPYKDAQAGFGND